MNTTEITNTNSLEHPAVASQHEPLRCLHRFSNGKRCRLPGSESQAGLCSHHFRLSLAASFAPSPSDSADLSADLLPELSECSSGVDLRKFLARLLILVTQGRISPRRASVLSYITYQLLHPAGPAKRKPAPNPIKSSLLHVARNLTEKTQREALP
jgi:hypothetical protein